MSIDPSERFQAYLQALKAEFPRFDLIQKDRSDFCKLVDLLLRVVTLGKQSTFMRHYVTTFGQRVYVPSDWAQRSPTERYIVLRHEAVHLRQFKRYTWPGMALLYLFPIFPLGFAYFRARLEWEAYQETLIATVECYGHRAACDSRLHDHIVRQFCSASYGWMWPFPKDVKRRIRRFVKTLERQ